jgi:hypothetical protein
LRILLDDFGGGEDGAGDEFGEGGGCGVDEGCGDEAVWVGGSCGVEACEEGFCTLVGCEECSCCSASAFDRGLGGRGISVQEGRVAIMTLPTP